MCERAALFGHQQNARRVAVQPVHQFQKFGLGPRAAKLLDHAKAHATAAVHRYAGGFVQRDQVVVFQQDGEFARRGRVVGLFGHFVGNPHGRQAHHIACGHTGVGLGAALVDPHLAAADDAVHVGFRHPFKVTHQEVVQPLAGGVFVNCNSAGGDRIGLYNVFH